LVSIVSIICLLKDFQDEITGKHPWVPHR